MCTRRGSGSSVPPALPCCSSRASTATAAPGWHLMPSCAANTLPTFHLRPRRSCWRHPSGWLHRRASRRSRPWCFLRGTPARRGRSVTRPGRARSRSTLASRSSSAWPGTPPPAFSSPRQGTPGPSYTLMVSGGWLNPAKETGPVPVATRLRRFVASACSLVCPSARQCADRFCRASVGVDTQVRRRDGAILCRR